MLESSLNLDLEHLTLVCKDCLRLQYLTVLVGAFKKEYYRAPTVLMSILGNSNKQ